MKISNIDDCFQQALPRVQIEDVGLIPDEFEVGEEMSLKR